MEKFTERLAAGQRLQQPEFLPEHQHQQAVLGDGKGQVPAGVAAPTIGARQPDGQVGVGPAGWIGLQQVEAAA